MITVFDSSNYAQQIFLNEAFAYLLKEKKETLSAQELAAGKFLSLDSYFAHISDLISIQPNYVLIPSDETPFEIDANSRTIKVPGNFSKCAGVVGDNMCEIITFTIDRYFDYTDLANAQICIQWQAGDEKGISQIGLRDYTTTSGKIRFGWPLTSNLTKKAGNITFAVRFYIEKAYDIETEKEVDIETADPATTKKQFVYLFNTLPATIPIREGLNVVEEEEVKFEQNVEGMFVKFVSNSQNPSYPMPQPVSYVEDLKEKTKIDIATNTLTLRVQATTKGDGWIDYKWFFKKGVAPKDSLTVPAVELLSDNVNYIINDQDYQLAGEEEKVNGDQSKFLSLKPNKQYYYNVEKIDGGETITNYYRAFYNKETQRVENIEGKAIPEDSKIFERYCTLTILDDTAGGTKEHSNKEITGVYYAEAINSVGADSSTTVEYSAITTDGTPVTVTHTTSGVNHTPPEQSVLCYLPIPGEIEFKENCNLKNTVFLNESGETTLEVELLEDSGNPDRYYTWFKTVNNVELERDTSNNWIGKENPEPGEEGDQVYEIYETETKDNSSVKVSTPGWYWATIKSQLNRDYDEENSEICRVVNEPEKPVVTGQYFRHGKNYEDLNKFAFSNYHLPKGDAALNEQYKKTLNNAAEWGSYIDLKIDIDPSIKSLLLSDSITYKWYRKLPDDNTIYEIVDAVEDESYQLAPSNDPDEPIAFLYECDDEGEFILDSETNKKIVKSVNSPTIRVRYQGTYNIEGLEDDQQETYYCEISNALGDKIATFTKDNDYKDNDVVVFHIK